MSGSKTTSRALTRKGRAAESSSSVRRRGARVFGGSVAAISKLSKELLLSVFKYYCLDTSPASQPPAFVLSAVSAQWRSLVVETSELWEEINVNCSTREKLLILQLDRSRQRPLTIRVYLQPPSLYTGKCISLQAIHSCLKTIAAEAHRWREFDLCYHSFSELHYCLNPQLVLRPLHVVRAPELRRLQIEAVGRDDFRDALRIDAPLCHDVALRGSLGVFIHYEMPIPWGITTLSLEYFPSYAPLDFRLFKALEALPRLTTLTIKRDIVWAKRSPSQRPIVLPDLKEYILVDMPELFDSWYVGGLEPLFRDLELPNLESLTFREPSLSLLRAFVEAIYPSCHLFKSCSCRGAGCLAMPSLLSRLEGKPVRYPQLSAFHLEGNFPYPRDDRIRDHFFAALSPVADIYVDASCVLNFVRALVATLEFRIVWWAFRSHRLIIPQWSPDIDNDELISWLSSSVTQRRFQGLRTRRAEFERYCSPEIQMELRELIRIDFEEPDCSVG